MLLLQKKIFLEKFGDPLDSLGNSALAEEKFKKKSFPHVDLKPDLWVYSVAQNH